MLDIHNTGPIFDLKFISFPNDKPQQIVGVDKTIENVLLFYFNASLAHNLLLILLTKRFIFALKKLLIFQKVSKVTVVSFMMQNKSGF